MNRLLVALFVGVWTTAAPVPERMQEKHDAPFVGVWTAAAPVPERIQEEHDAPFVGVWTTAASVPERIQEEHDAPFVGVWTTAAPVPERIQEEHDAPFVGVWTTAASVPERIQEEHGALYDGRIYIAGGFDSTDSPTKRAYRYDPRRDAWERIADLPAERHHMPLVVLNDTLYAIGGLEGNARFDAVTTVWIYRPDGN